MERDDLMSVCEAAAFGHALARKTLRLPDPNEATKAELAEMIMQRMVKLGKEDAAWEEKAQAAQWRTR